MPGEKIPSWEWPRPRAISDVWTSRHLSSMTRTAIIPRFRISDSRVRDRLYYACTGWIGRNVFFRWKTGHTPSEFTQRNRQLAAGAKALARYTNDRRFLYLPDIQSAAESWLPDMIGQYQKSKEAWNELTERWFGR